MSWAESLQNILTNSNSWITLLFVTLFFVIILVCVKTGLVSINTTKVKISSRDKEQKVMREQISYAHYVCMSSAQHVLRTDRLEDIDPKHIDNIMEKVYDEFIEWIIFNHISTDEIYVKNKTAKIFYIIDSLVPPDINYESYNDFISETVKKTIEELVRIRKIYL